MIRISDLSKTFGATQALCHVHMHVPQGSIYGLVGPNGAGKSTLLRHVTGAYRPDTGIVTINGEPVYDNPRVKETFAYIPDDFFYFMQANTIDMMKFYRGLYPDFDENLFYRICRCFPAVKPKQNLASLSKGTQKQAAFALSLACRPSLLILDEPVDGLDPVMRRQLWSLLMSDVVDRKTTVLLSSHNLRELEDVCDHVGIMNRGSLLMEHSLDDLQASITKIQIAFEGETPPLPESLEVMHKIVAGRVSTLVVKGKPKEAQQRLAALHPILMDVLPLTLEEIFIYELEGEHYAVKDVIF